MTGPDPEWEALQHKVRDAVADSITGSTWAPPEGAILTECVVVMGWFNADGTYGSSHLRCGSPWGTRGLVIGACERIEAHENDFDDEDGEA